MGQRAAAICFAAVMSGSSHASAQDAWTYEAVLGRVREHASVIAARTRIDEARGRLRGASRLLDDNPEISAGVGARLSPDDTTPQIEVGIEQRFPLGGGRSARVAAGEASVAQAEAESDEVLRELLFRAGRAYLRRLHADALVSLTASSASVAGDLQRIIDRRVARGDLPRADLSLLRLTAGRAEAEHHDARARRAAASNELALLLGVPAESLAVQGELKDRTRFRAAASGRDEPPEIRALSAEVLRAHADRELGRAMGWPELGVGASWEREEGSDVFLGRLALTLPIFARGQGVEAEAEAAARRLEIELELARARFEGEARAAQEIFLAQDRAASALEAVAVADMDEIERAALGRFAAGDISLSDLLGMRREVLGFRRELIDRQLEAAQAGNELLRASGGLR
jgi:cobalt-zinc-cadmium efflux system outer membrane protein